jgi:hypothetical protein
MNDPHRITFQPEHDGTLSLESVVGQAVGAASMCWEHVEAAGVFDDRKARAVVEALLEYLRAPAALRAINPAAIDLRPHLAKVATRPGDTVVLALTIDVEITASGPTAGEVVDGHPRIVP